MSKPKWIKISRTVIPDQMEMYNGQHGNCYVRECFEVLEIAKIDGVEETRVRIEYNDYIMGYAAPVLEALIIIGSTTIQQIHKIIKEMEEV